MDASPAPVLGAPRCGVVVYLLSPADGRAYMASLRSYYSCEVPDFLRLPWGLGAGGDVAGLVDMSAPGGSAPVDRRAG
eukprot:6164421-Alexandrium_andersonii.AAC.1